MFYFYDGTANLKDETFIPHHYKNGNVKNKYRRYSRNKHFKTKKFYILFFFYKNKMFRTGYNLYC